MQSERVFPMIVRPLENLRPVSARITELQFQMNEKRLWICAVQGAGGCCCGRARFLPSQMFPGEARHSFGVGVNHGLIRTGRVGGATGFGSPKKGATRPRTTSS